jgi:DNA-binding MarR family transcriptional regulator
MTAPVGKPPAIDRAIQGLQRLTELFERRRSQLAREVGLTDPQWRVLEEIARDEFMPSLFARARESHPAAVSRTLRQLQERDLVTASISSADGRQRQYAVTGRGRRLLGRLRASRERAIDAVWAGLPARDLERFAAFSERLADRLEAYARDEDGEGGG